VQALYNDCNIPQQNRLTTAQGYCTMARYKPYSYAQGKFIPVHFAKQILPDTFEYSLNHIIDHELDLSLFNVRFGNDQTGATAYRTVIIGILQQALFN